MEKWVLDERGWCSEADKHENQELIVKLQNEYIEEKERVKILEEWLKNLSPLSLD